ncbi:unnamed protein product [Linum tenue]|uniref:F-box domain-containing protein n=1 Tax=Linum tenue TaxID=586396 RepID=A0AAV0IW33_9ROSI|nr:unnamed protein product [Linum tenue]
MKIWCCLCFTFDDEVGPDTKGYCEAMRDAALKNDSHSRGVGIGANGEDPGEAAPTFDYDMLDTHDRDGTRLFEEMIRAAEGGDAAGESVNAPPSDDGVAIPVALRRSTLRFAQRLRGETSGTATTVVAEVSGNVVEDCNRDWHSKRAKVYSGSHDCQYVTVMSPDAGHSNSSEPMDSNFTQSHGVPSGDAIVYHNFIWNSSNDETSFGSNGGGDESGPSKSDDLEIRMDLSDDLLYMVFSFLGHVDLCRAAMVCKQWRTASTHEDFWRYLNLENRNVTLEQFEDMCHRYPNAVEVNLHGAPALHYLVMKAVSSLRNLETLTLGRGQLGDPFFHALAECNLLRSLNVNDATLGNGMQEIPINHDRLQHLQLIKCRVLRISIRCPELQTLSLKRSNMGQAVLSCPLLHALDIGSCHKLSDAAIRSAAISCPQLESLDMSNCSCVSDETLREIAQTCANLHILDASYCPNVSLESVRLPLLTELRLHSCEGITSASIAAISYSYMLEKLALLRQENLTTLALQCQCLQEVDLTDCESLTNSICEVFSDGGGCPMLRSLILDNCESLTTVRFCSTSLLSLSLVGCRAITSLDLICPCLEKVCLDGCDHLERASFCPVALRSLNLGICPKLSTLRIEAPSMVSLELKGCGVLCEASINCPLLTSLDASFCSQLKDDCLSATAASCPLIDSLILMSCPSVGSDGLYSLRCLPNLTVLDLSYTFLMNLLPVFQSCLQLKVLKLQACKYLTDDSLEPLYKEGALPMLQELDLSYGTLCQSAIEDLLACCTHLTHLSLNGCVNMHDLNWGCSSGQVTELPTVNSPRASFSLEDNYAAIEQPNRLLQNLNCVGCRNIRKALIPPMARCSHLSSFNLSLSTNLKEVDIACLNLGVLNLSNCYALVILKLQCPRLTSLFLQSCNINEEAVEAAIFQCNMLETLDVRFCPKIISISMFRLRGACPSLKRVFSSLLSTS